MAPGTLTRRPFLQFLGGAAVMGAGYWATRHPVKLGLIGAGKRGAELAALCRRTWADPQFASLVAIADVDAVRAEGVRQTSAPKAELYANAEQLLSREDIAGVLIATPDHWHALHAIDALKMGKAVYCEQPLTLTVDEGTRIIEAAHRAEVPLLAGTWRRCATQYRTACELVRANRLGTIHQVEITIPERRTVVEGPFASRTPPAHLDWERWLGPAPFTSYCWQRQQLPRGWYDYSGGELTEWGGQYLDIVHWALRMEKGGPSLVRATGEMPTTPDGFTTPSRFTATLQYPGALVVRLQTVANPATSGICFEGTGGRLFVNDAGLRAVAAALPLEPEFEPLAAHAPAGQDGQLQHLRHFLACVMGRVAPLSDVESAQRATAACQIANIALRLDRPVQWNAVRQAFVNDPEAARMLSCSHRSPYRLA